MDAVAHPLREMAVPFPVRVLPLISPFTRPRHSIPNESHFMMSFSHTATPMWPLRRSHTGLQLSSVLSTSSSPEPWKLTPAEAHEPMMQFAGWTDRLPYTDNPATACSMRLPLMVFLSLWTRSALIGAEGAESSVLADRRSSTPWAEPVCRSPRDCPCKIRLPGHESLSLVLRFSVSPPWGSCKLGILPSAHLLPETCGRGGAPSDT